MNSLSNNRKILSVMVVFVTLICSCICYYSNKSNGFEISVGGTTIAYVKDIATFNNVKKDVENNLRKRFGNIKINENIIENKVKVDKALLTSKTDVKNNLLIQNNMEVTACAMLSDNKEIALVANQSEGKAVEEYIEKYYETKANLKEVTEAAIKNNITYTTKKVNLSKVEEVEDAAVNIINANYKSKNPILTVVLKGAIATKEVIAAATVTNISANIKPGETQVQKEGKDGSKIVSKQVVIENRTIISENVLSENIVEKPESKVVLVGGKAAVGSSIASVLPPSRGTITSSFGERWGKNHNGVDIGAPVGTPIYALKDGIVSYASWEEGYGNCIKIDHDGKLQTIYGHCSAIEVKVGQKVTAKQEIGKVGSTGRSTGPHLHFEVRLAGVAVEPTQYLRN